MPRSVTVLACAAVTAVFAFDACQGFKDAMTAHVDVVARAASQELSVTRLATLVGKSKLPVDHDFVRQLAQVWVDYQLLGHAAAVGDSLNEPATVDSALWGVMANSRAKKWVDQLSKGWVGGDTLQFATRYANGEVLAARHILIASNGDSSPAKMDSLRRRAITLRAQLTPANFAEMARKNSGDPGSGPRGGDLGVFQRGQMVPAFEQALLALKPGEISPPVRTQFGWHLIFRPSYDDVKDQVARAASSKVVQSAESLYVAQLDSSARVKMAPAAASTVRAVAKDPELHRSDRSLIASYSAGDFTAARLAKWMEIFPPQARSQLQAAPDSQIPVIVRSIVRNELVIRQADSAKVTLDSAETNGIRRGYEQVITNAWTQLGVDPKTLADSGRTPAVRERLAAARVEEYLDRLLSMSARYVDVPSPVNAALRSRYDAQINDAGVDRAFARASEIRKSADSARSASAPPSAVPLPGGASAAPPAARPAAPSPTPPAPPAGAKP
jgi:hypothetical protein